ncbi:unnamed protein product [Ascophyllum nodosum]
MNMTDGRRMAMCVFKQLKEKDTRGEFCAEVDLALCPGYLEVCPQPMDLGTVERKIGRFDRRKVEYRELAEFIRDMRHGVQQPRYRDLRA